MPHVKPTSAEKMDTFKAELATMTKPIEVEKKKRYLPTSRFGQAMHVRGNDFCITVPSQLTYQDVLTPDFWTLVAGKLRIGNIIEVRHDEMKFWALVIVVASDQHRGLCEVRELIYKDLAAATMDQVEHKGFSASYRGLTDQWTITRDVDGHVMRTGIESQAKAQYIIETEMIAHQITSGLQLS